MPASGAGNPTSENALRKGLAVIPGACPRMFLDPVDVPHRCMRWVLGATGKLLEPQAYAPEDRAREESLDTA